MEAGGEKGGWETGFIFLIFTDIVKMGWDTKRFAVWRDCVPHVETKTTRHRVQRGIAHMLPLSVLQTAKNQPMLVELRNGDTFNGHLVNCDNFMNINLRDVIHTSRDGDKFYNLKACYIRGNQIKYLRIPEDVIDMVPDEPVYKGRGGRGRGRGRGGYRGGRGRGKSRGGGGNGYRGAGGRGRGRNDNNQRGRRGGGRGGKRYDNNKSRKNNYNNNSSNRNNSKNKNKNSSSNSRNSTPVRKPNTDAGSSKGPDATKPVGAQAAAKKPSRALEMAKARAAKRKAEAAKKAGGD